MSKTKTATEILIEIFGEDDVNTLIPYTGTVRAMEQYAQEKLKEQRYEYKANEILLKARVAVLQEKLKERDNPYKTFFNNMKSVLAFHKERKIVPIGSAVLRDIRSFIKDCEEKLNQDNE